MQRKLGLTLATALMMFPQIVETIYSPALTNIAKEFKVSAEQAAQTLSLYFFAFAIGVVVWGRMCDLIGRRPTILSGLLLYSGASLMALFSVQFELLLAARMLSAFGAAVGSVGTQTIMRDSYQGSELARVFSIMGVALAVSPAVGMVSGSILVYFWGYKGVFSGLSLLAVLLSGWSAICLPETRPVSMVTISLIDTLIIMLKDVAIWCNALLIAFFNLCLFSYYQLAPFDFERLGLSSEMFGYTGLLLALGAGIGAFLNRFLLNKRWHSSNLMLLASIITLIGGGMIMVLEDTWLFILPMVLIVVSYGIAVPNILASALINYTDRLGTAGALLGLLYYLMLGIGLALAGWSQHLGVVLMCCGCFILLLVIINFFMLIRTENNISVTE
ncbi:Bcr/CflA family efflux MFS transporter [Photorhabdus laumondii subsp. laumondii]|uniref:Bcr/CflA family efflux transporter n=2 Tax=Photorhabdus laumondii subsp. laumondii TaxID=141679 RepID=Q7N014_PHOLL|nr:MULTISPECIES: multidrug effflux MFS transporter [Photorhabdus]AWK43669.1 MFS transporter [Photorhabdus laumondii subsp. laumondii]AXG44350.1 Bcr/CflA family drug resistance efflux transporter [Photorhabdus laumondii subsp. laumondii]AXG48980.1 Bcr/CflA family drug resistance efflux transporter [Photorhabdus laumondii subsp. laumondii]KTL59463.1 MFS transporter [Photorhabdus laumondii subsp. laumondii]MCC8385556.1 multidrug effflux MFS transporter [Photorhabdus laumondii]